MWGKIGRLVKKVITKDNVVAVATGALSKEAVLVNVFKAIVRKTPQDELVHLADYLIDILEVKIDESETQLDDMFLEPLIDIVRSAFGIDDNDIVL